MNAQNIQDQIRYVAYNPISRKYEEVDLQVSEFVEDQTVLKQYGTKAGWVTIPGDCEYILRNNEWVSNE